MAGRRGACSRVSIISSTLSSVTVRPTTALTGSPEPSVVEHPAQPVRGLQASAERLVQDLGRHMRDVQPHLVQQGHRSHRETEADHGPIDHLHRHALREQATGLVQVRREDSVDPEAGPVAHDDHR